METLEALKHLLWPTRCASCDVLLSNPSMQVCASCMKGIVPAGACAVPEGLSGMMAIFEYAGPIGTMIGKWKYHEDYAAQKALMSLISDHIERLKAYVPEDVCLIPVPPHPKRLRERGFDPVWTFAAKLRRILENGGIEATLCDDLLIRTRHTKRQATLTEEERKHNLSGAFKVVQSLPTSPIILVDDVITTGATTAACAQTLRAAGAEWVGALALAHPVKH